MTTPSETPNLDAFMEGHSDGYNGRPRKTKQGATYLRAYKSGAEARARLLPEPERGSILSRGKHG
jgi:hypothetical protein